MHEMSIAESVLAIVSDTARGGGLARVSAVRLEIGALAAVDVAALRFCFDSVTRGSLAEAAALEIEEAPGRAWCFGCGEAVSIRARGEDCPRCGGARLQVTDGTQMRVKDIRGN
jgi:hydrogenase nickel incorporation protein HypA/HybF